ncbi:MAG: hypothetical protein J6Y89_05830, partial [Lachnospiraceae bacterium]|nr:hypothetical protein [Lachnospiraceae bacterium]
MKRIISLLLIVTMLISIAGCSKDSGNGNVVEDQTGSGNTETTVPTEVPTATPEPTTTPEPTATPTPEPTPTPVPGAKVTLLLPSKYNNGVYDEAGTIEAITYMAHDYLGDGPDVEKKAFVYLPYGYDETKQYNVMYLCHGIGGSETEWGLGTGNASRVKKIMDNLIKDGDIEPFIV